MRTFLITVQTPTQLANLLIDVDGPVNVAALEWIKAEATRQLNSGHVVITYMFELEAS